MKYSYLIFVFLILLLCCTKSKNNIRNSTSTISNTPTNNPTIQVPKNNDITPIPEDALPEEFKIIISNLQNTEMIPTFFTENDIYLDKQYRLLPYIYKSKKELLFKYADLLELHIKATNESYANPLVVLIDNNDIDLFIKMVINHNDFIYGTTYIPDGAYNRSIFSQVVFLDDNLKWLQFIDSLNWFNPNKVPVVGNEYIEVGWACNYLSVYTRRMGSEWDNVRNYDYGLRILFNHGIETQNMYSAVNDYTIVDNAQIFKDPSNKSEVIGNIKQSNSELKRSGNTYQYFDHTPLFHIEYQGITGWIKGTDISVYNNQQ